uniref:Helix-turn-helix domain-containing protein n=1 Tax=Trichobilharzia regenti TaxID=157069 RepID=A0AA85JJN0_TRIRE|nr:unnamed protein product [Trichobilharzia regenti]
MVIVQLMNMFRYDDITRPTRKEDGAIRKSVYRKPTSTGQYTDFLSFVPLKYKRNLIKCLVHRARAICSDDCLDEELNNIERLLSENGYPEKFTDKNMNLKSKQPKLPTVPKKEGLILTNAVPWGQHQQKTNTAP